MIIHSEDGLKYDVQWSIKTIQTTQHVITSDQLNTTGAELGPAQPQLVFYLYPKDFLDYVRRRWGRRSGGDGPELQGLDLLVCRWQFLTWKTMLGACHWYLVIFVIKHFGMKLNPFRSLLQLPITPLRIEISL